MRLLSRFIGLLLAAAAFVAFVVDGARSIADDAVRSEIVSALWRAVSPGSFGSFRAAVETILGPAWWNDLVEPVLGVPLFVVLLLLATLFLWLGRRPRSRIGYVVRG